MKWKYTTFLFVGLLAVRDLKTGSGEKGKLFGFISLAFFLFFCLTRMADQMKSSKNSNIAIIVGITLLCFALWRFFDKPILNEAAGSSAPKNQISAAERLEDAVKNVKEEIQARGNARDFEKALQKEILSLNQPMDFYGKVVDHLGRGIADATIVYTWDVQQAAPWVPTKASSDRIQSQPDGTFEIHLKAVRWITIYKITRDGYVRPYGGDRVGRDYSKEADTTFYTSDPKKPELFYLTPVADIVPLYSNKEVNSGFDQRIELPKNGTPINIDVRTGKADPKGALEITLNLGKRVDGAYPYTPWTAKIGMPGGGVVDVSPAPGTRYPELAPVAPLEGYREEIAYPDPMLRSSDSRSIYFCTREGMYGLLKCQINANHLGGGVHLNVFLNPNPGNRLLHFDPHKRIK